MPRNSQPQIGSQPRSQRSAGQPRRPAPARAAAGSPAMGPGSARSEDTFAGSAARSETQPWHRLPGESGIAHDRFMIFRDLGPTRTIAAAARAVGKCASLLYRWAERYHWWERVHAWDLAQQRDQEMAARRRTQDSEQRWTRNADRLERLAMAIISGVVRPNPQTDELGIDSSVKLRDAVAIIKLVLGIHDRLAAAAPAPAPPDASALDARLNQLTDEEAEELIRLLDTLMENMREHSGTEENR